MNNNKAALKSGIYYTIFNFLVRSIGFITTPIFTRLLTKEDFGLYNNYISWQSIFLIFITLSLESTLISARYDYGETLDSYILSIMVLSSLSSITWLLLCNCFADFFVNFLGIRRAYLNIMLIYLLFLPAINLFQTKERYEYQYKKTVFISTLVSFSTAFLSVILVLILKNKLSGRILGSVIPTVLIGLILYGYFFIKGKKISISYWGYALKICLPYILHLFAGVILGSVDRIMIAKYCGAGDTALYSLAYNCGSIVTLLFTSVNSAFGPWLAEKLHANAWKEVRSFSKIYILIAEIFSLGVMLISPEVLWMLGGNTYMEAIYVMAPVTMGCVCQFLYTMFVNVEQIQKKTFGMAIATASAALLNFILNQIFIPRFGYIAAAYTTLAGYLWLLLVHMFLLYQMGKKNIYSYSYIFISISILAFITIGMNYLYLYSFLRYIILIIYFLALSFLIYKKKDYLFKVLKRKNGCVLGSKKN